jgi:hypothetical protein
MRLHAQAHMQLGGTLKGSERLCVCLCVPGREVARHLGVGREAVVADGLADGARAHAPRQALAHKVYRLRTPHPLTL